jgi:acetyl esterase/lipase
MGHHSWDQKARLDRVDPPVDQQLGAILVGEIIEFAQRAKHAGVDISLHTVPEGQHSFIMGASHVPEANEAIEQMGRWVRSRLNLDDMRHSVMSTS